MSTTSSAFKSSSGANCHPTALEIIQNNGLEGKLQDKVILITGCSSGIGIDTARALSVTGATLYLTARDLKKAEQALGDLIEKPNVHLLTLNLNSLASVRACAEEFLSKSSQLNILINNAGVMATPEGRTQDGFETQFGTNHLGHFTLFYLLKPILLASSTPEFNSRVVNVSSRGGHMVRARRQTSGRPMRSRGDMGPRAFMLLVFTLVALGLGYSSMFPRNRRTHGIRMMRYRVCGKLRSTGLLPLFGRR